MTDHEPDTGYLAKPAPLPNPDAAAKRALPRAGMDAAQLARELGRARAQRRGIAYLAENFRPTADIALTAVFRQAVLTLATDSSDKPLAVGDLRRMLAAVTGDDQALAEISGQAPGGGAT